MVCWEHNEIDKNLAGQLILLFESVSQVLLLETICGMKPIIVHPRMDFMFYGMDAIVNQAAKWSYMLLQIILA